MRFLKQAILCAGLLAALGLQGCGQPEGGVSQDAYDETIRCFKAATAYGQVLGLLGKSDEQKAKMLDYGLDQRNRAVAEGAKLKKTEAEVLGSMDRDYLSRFLVLEEQQQKAELTDFGKAEVEHCKLDAVIEQGGAD